ncbi:MAG: DNA double-strand break repair nuclease NurA [Chloroflexota bacterium]
MTLELNQVASQVRAMGQSLAQQRPDRDQTLRQARSLLQQFSTQFSELHERVQRAERVQQSQRFGWVGAAPDVEALAEAYALPACPERLTIIASDGSQILPDQHAIYPYYVINIGSITYRHGSHRKPDTYHPPPVLNYEPFDELGRLISVPEVNVQRDLAELDILVDRVQQLGRPPEPIIALMDGQLSLRVIDLPYDQQQAWQDKYVKLLDALRRSQALLGAYIDRPRSTFVLALLHLASLEIAGITEESLHHSPFRYLTDLDLFDFLAPGERSAIFTVRAKGLDKYESAGHTVHFFYLNVGQSRARPYLARLEIPAWLAGDRPALDTLHAAVVRQARITGGYPYVLARADELAVISAEEREAVEMMLALELRRLGLNPEISSKQRQKNAFRFSKRRF